MDLRALPPVGKKIVHGLACGPGGCRPRSIEIDDYLASPRSDALVRRRQAIGLSRRELLALDPSIGLTQKDLNEIEFARLEPVDAAGWAALEGLLALAERRAA